MSEIPAIDWKDRVSVLNLTCFIVIIGGLIGLAAVIVLKPDVLSNPNSMTIINFFVWIITTAFGFLAGKEVAAQTLKTARRP